jgi:hypothetical protein
MYTTYCDFYTSIISYFVLISSCLRLLPHLICFFFPPLSIMCVPTQGVTKQVSLYLCYCM